MSDLTVAVTGAAGFVGRATVAALRARGHAVRALLRRADQAPAAWGADPRVAVHALDLGAPAAGPALAAALQGVDAVIHAAAAMGGDDAAQARDTLAPTQALLAALAGMAPPPRLVLVSSYSVYDLAALPEGRPLDETAPLEIHGGGRDAYARAKLAQERMARAAAAEGLPVWLLRPGAIFGPGRLWNAHLGHPVGPLLLQLERAGEVPVAWIGHVAEALARAAERAPEGPGGVEAVNVLDDDRPDRAAYLAELRKGGWPTAVLPLPWRWLAALGRLLAARAPARLARKLPGLLRPETLAARMRPVTHDNAALHARLGWAPTRRFAEAMAAARQEERDAR